jgi:hypothetical protein
MVMVSLWALKFIQNLVHIAATAQTLDISKLDTMFGHPNSEVLAATVTKYGLHTKNTLEHTCPKCAIITAKQRISTS